MVHTLTLVLVLIMVLVEEVSTHFYPTLYILLSIYSNGSVIVTFRITYEANTNQEDQELASQTEVALQVEISAGDEGAFSAFGTVEIIYIAVEDPAVSTSTLAPHTSPYDILQPGDFLYD